jgi:hypothetical protein
MNGKTRRWENKTVTIVRRTREAQHLAMGCRYRRNTDVAWGDMALRLESGEGKLKELRNQIHDRLPYVKVEPSL